MCNKILPYMVKNWSNPHVPRVNMGVYIPSLRKMCIGILNTTFPKQTMSYDLWFDTIRDQIVGPYTHYWSPADLALVPLSLLAVPYVILLYVAGRVGYNVLFAKNYFRNRDRYTSSQQIHDRLRDLGFEGCSVTVAIDTTLSNQMNGNDLHCLNGEGKSEYEVAMESIVETLSDFDDDNLIPVYGFGDNRTRASKTFNFKTNAVNDDEPCEGLADALDCYRERIGDVTMSGPTSFAPVIRKAMAAARKNKDHFHVVVILTDGAVSDQGQTEKAIVDASFLPISIVAVGIGDDNDAWDVMEHYDDRMGSARRFDNFQFVPFNAYRHSLEKFKVAALQELPEQIEYWKGKGTACKR